MGIVIGSVEFYAGPTVLGAPDDLEAVILEFLAGARKTLSIAVQEIDSRTLAQAIIDAKARGVRVRVILEGDYLVEPHALADPWTAVVGGLEENRVIYAALLRAGIDVITDLNPAIFHQKFVVRDEDLDSGAVLTGSTNFTLTDTGKNDGADPEVVGNNLNHVVILRGRNATKQYLAEFERLRSGTFGDLHERHEERPAEFKLGDMRVKPLFAPQHGPEMEIMKQMLKSHARIDFAMFTFSQSSGIDDTMDRLVGPNLSIRGALDHGQGVQTWAATEPLKARGVQLYENAAGSGVRKIHHKLMVIDERLLIAGSFNYTEPATLLNDENIVVIGDLEEPAGTAADVNQRRLAGFALAEIDRIISDLCDPV
ncbi:MAG TPA: phospholipase D-like domain-containing protein [Nocardioidaceae bacterium]|nr:phospholipase D-like domain-containing protein [Nocardioidaceae bacterium]